MQRVPQIRFNLWLEYYDEYNCSLAGDVDWASTGVSQPLFGSICILFGAITIPLYLFCLSVMWPLRALSVYKIMCFLALADIGDLIVNSIIFGIMEIRGEVYCMHPFMILICSMAAIFFFFCSTITCTLLALNRFGELLAIRPIILLFDKTRTWLTLCVSIPYGLFIVIFTPPMLFNSKYHMFLFDPLITEKKFQYVNYFHIVVTVLLPFISTIVYAIMLVALVYRYANITMKKSSNALNKAAYRILIQCGIIIVIHMTTCICYELLQFVPATEGMLYFTHVGWMMVHGSPPYVYLMFNNAIRDRIECLLCRRVESVLAPSSNPSGLFISKMTSIG